MHKAFKFRLYPNRNEQTNLTTQFGHARFVYNNGLDARKKHYGETGTGLTYTGTANRLPGLKTELTWLREADSQVLQQKLKDLDRAYGNFFQGRARYPKFKSKSDTQTIRYPQRFKFNGNRIYLPKVGWVKLKRHRAMEGTPKSISDASWGAFVRMCEYKAPWYGSEVRKVGRFFPSSKLCSHCGQVNANLKLSDRSWTCICGVTHDRDVNAAINVLIECTVGATESEACGDGVSHGNLCVPVQPSMNQEAQEL